MSVAASSARALVSDCFADDPLRLCGSLADLGVALGRSRESEPRLRVQHQLLHARIGGLRDK